MAACRRPSGRRRAGAPRDWPIGWRLPADPWAGAPLFDPALERQAAVAARVTCGRPLTGVVR